MNSGARYQKRFELSSQSVADDARRTLSARTLPLSNDELMALTIGLRSSPIKSKESPSVLSDSPKRPLFRTTPEPTTTSETFVGHFTCNENGCTGLVAVWCSADDQLSGVCSACFGYHSEQGFQPYSGRILGRRHV